eukprot:TRINITY_DN41762_c0_g1_i1.p1 TRINITY_DN41762_c0_g1~~TRINITY_DN41762_c0_g1_i1.p1  ORF type:complete len:393 (-),score=70.23 TRINITY_DN41762_c0_g1_i1:208-1386(-)
MDTDTHFVAGKNVTTGTEESSGVCVFGDELPSATEFWTTCYEATPGFYLTMWAIASSLIVAQMAISAIHLSSLYKRGLSNQWWLYNRIALYPVVLGLMSWMVVLAPRTHLLAVLLETQWKAIALRDFSIVISLLLFREGLTAKVDAIEDGCNSPQAQAVALQERLHPVKNILRAFRSDGEKKIWAVPPLGCCFAPLMKPKFMQTSDLRFISLMMSQFVYVTPLLAYILVWGVLNLPCEDLLGLKKFCNQILTLSGVVAMYGVQIIFQSAKNILQDWRPCLKFMSFQIILLLSLVQTQSLAAIARSVQDLAGPCLERPGFEHFVNAWLTLPQALAMALMMKAAFPGEDLRPFMGADLQVNMLDFQLADAADDEESDVGDDSTDCTDEESPLPL